jgi:hypothetical protein
VAVAGVSVSLPGLIVPTMSAPVSKSVISPEFAGDSMGPTDVSICPLAGGDVRRSGYSTSVQDRQVCAYTFIPEHAAPAHVVG